MFQRVGKTHKDRNSGAKARNYTNKMQRASWCKDGGDFPFSTCNGKKNVFMFTGKGGIPVFTNISKKTKFK